MRWNILTWCGIVLMNVVPVMSAPSAKERARAAQEIQAGFDRDIQPLLEKYCYSCHGNGKHKGDLALDRFRVVENILADVKPWLSVLRNIHSGEPYTCYYLRQNRLTDLRVRATHSIQGS